ncbi:MAG TPA: isoprenylcysteine carboxylmethyltransferase family protein [Bacteroidales bacterium]|nr:isoprenylcysteine carboxylmethyltransferase family protein [Bacteroidales bacterium]
MKNIIKQLISFILPITVLIIIPLGIEKNISIKSSFALIIGFSIILIGLYAMIVTISTFIRIGKGTLAPWNPTRKLIISGMHGYVRNPMIMGVMTVLIGESIVILSIKILVWAAVFFLINNIYFVIYEEPNLEKKFGDEYREYKKNVPRWIPRLKPFTANSELK